MSFLRADEVLENCDVCLVVGTSSVVYPAAAFAPRLVKKGVPVAEFNLETTPCTSNFQYVPLSESIVLFRLCLDFDFFFLLSDFTLKVLARKQFLRPCSRNGGRLPLFNNRIIFR